MSESVFCSSNLLTQVSSLVFDVNGILYASNFGNPNNYGSIIKIDKNGIGTLLTYLGNQPNNFISCLAYYNNYLYVSVFASTGYIYKVDITNGSYSIFSTISGSQICTSGIVYYQNFLYVVAFLSTGNFNGVYKIDISNGTNSLFISPSTYNLTTGGDSFIAVDSNGNFYITNTNNVAKFDNNGNLLQSTFITYTQYNNILFNDNFFYFTDKTSNQISKYDINGTLITHNYAAGGSTYTGGGMAFDSNGNFYVSNETNGGGAGNVTINILNNSGPPCFNEETKILCLNKNLEEEYIPIENLRKGTLVKSYKHGYRRIDLIGKNSMINNPEKFNECMYKMEKTEENGLLDDLVVTGGHSILVDDLGICKEENDKIFGTTPMIDDKYLLLSAVSKEFVKLENTNLYTYYHFILENNGNDDERFGVWANGILTEIPSKNYFTNHKFTLL
jgi:hypothetical protein